MRTTDPNDRPVAAIGNAIFGGLADTMERHRTAPPRTQAITRAKLGAGLLVVAVYGVVVYAKDVTGRSAGELVAAFMRAPSNPPQDVWLPLAIEGAIVLLGAVWLMSGVRGSAGFPKDGMKAWWSGVRLALYAGALWYTTYGDPTWRGGLSSIHLGLLLLAIPELLGFLLQLRSGGRAETIVSKQIEDDEIKWRPARGQGG